MKRQWRTQRGKDPPTRPCSMAMVAKGWVYLAPNIDTMGQTVLPHTADTSRQARVLAPRATHPQRMWHH